MFSLHIDTARTWRGGQNQVLLTVNGLRAVGQRAALVAHPGGELRRRAAEGLELIPIAPRTEMDLSAAWKLSRLVKRLAPDVIHAHDPHGIAMASLALSLGAGAAAAAGGARTPVLVASRRYADYIGWIGELDPYKVRLDEKQLWSTLPIVVVIDDGNGYRSIYAHFSKVEVKRGDPVVAGDFLGYEGMTGRASGCHLHYGLFSPLETATFGMETAIARRMKLPRLQIARIDPLLVLPPRPQDQPSASPSVAPSLALPVPSVEPIPSP